nr:hypothetical protein [Tanacetum cinerariifolium]
MSPENKAHYESEKKAIHLLLTGIGDEIYSTVHACKKAHEIWIAIERLQKDESLNIQDMHLIWWKMIVLMLVHMVCEILVLDNKYLDMNVKELVRYVKDNQTGQFRNQRTVTVAEARETVGSQVVQQTGIQCFNCKEFGHFAKECRKPKRVKDYSFHKKKMLSCKQSEKCVPLQAKQADWLTDMNEEIDEQELEEHYIYMAKIQEVPTSDSGTDTEPLEQVQYGSMSSLEADSYGGVISLAISLPLCLVDAFDLVEDDCFDVGAYGL